MRTKLICEENEAPVSSFVGRFIAGVCIAVAASLKAPAAKESIQYELDGDDVRLQIDGASVPLELGQGFAKTIIRDTLRGMVQSLKGMDAERGIRIIIELDGPQ